MTKKVSYWVVKRICGKNKTHRIEWIKELNTKQQCLNCGHCALQTMPGKRSNTLACFVCGTIQPKKEAEEK